MGVLVRAGVEVNGDDDGVDAPLLLHLLLFLLLPLCNHNNIDQVKSSPSPPLQSLLLQQHSGKPPY